LTISGTKTRAVAMSPNPTTHQPETAPLNCHNLMV
jgi:hypothetical protein